MERLPHAVSWDSCSHVDSSYTDLLPVILLDAASRDGYGQREVLQLCKVITQIGLLPPSLYIHRFLRSHSLRRIGFAQDAGSTSISFDTVDPNGPLSLYATPGVLRVTPGQSTIVLSMPADR
jgi:hypothetical protein